VELNITVLIQLTIFLIAMLWLSLLLFRPMLRLLEEREKRIEGTRREAAALTAANEEKLKGIGIRIDEARALAYEQRRVLRAEGQKVYAETVERARQETQAQLERAQAEIAAARDRAQVALQTESQRLADAIVARLLDRPEGSA
jgi:F-type H+-transporting ATPase subunit b